MKRVLFFILILNGLSLSAGLINENDLVQALENNLEKTAISLSSSKHGGDNKVFLVKQNDIVIAVAKCYTKRNINEVNSICALSEMIREHLPIPRIISILVVNEIPVVIQEFLQGEHYESYSTQQMHEIALSMVKLHAISGNFELKSNEEFDYEYLFKLCSSFPDYEKVLSIYKSLNLDYIDEIPLTLIHGDISRSNLLFLANQLTGIIDLDHTRFSYRLTDITRAQVFFSFDSNGNLNENQIQDFVTAYNNQSTLSKIELDYFYNHLKLLLIKMILETYYYVEILKAVPLEAFTNSSFNQSWQMLLNKLYSVEDKSALKLK